MSSNFEKLNFISSTPMVKLKNKSLEDINQNISVSVLRELHLREKKLKKYSEKVKKYIEKYQKNVKAHEKIRKSFIGNYMSFSDKNESSFTSSSASYSEYSAIEKLRKTTFSEIDYTNNDSDYLRSFSNNSSSKSDYQKAFESLSLKKQPENLKRSISIVNTELNGSNNELQINNQLLASERKEIVDCKSDDESILDFENEEKLNLQLEKAAGKQELINASLNAKNQINIENSEAEIDDNKEYEYDEMSSYKSHDSNENGKSKVSINKPDNRLLGKLTFIEGSKTNNNNETVDMNSNSIGRSDSESQSSKSSLIGESNNNPDETGSSELCSVHDGVSDYSVQTIDKVKEWLRNSNSNVVSGFYADNFGSSVAVKSNNEPSSIYINCNEEIADENKEFFSNIHVNFRDNIEILDKSSSIRHNRFETDSESINGNKRVVSDFIDGFPNSINEEDEGMYSDERRASWKSINEDIIACVNKSTNKKNELLNTYNLSKSRIIVGNSEGNDNRNNSGTLELLDSTAIPNILTSTRLDNSDYLISQLVNENQLLRKLLINPEFPAGTKDKGESEISHDLSSLIGGETRVDKSFLLNENQRLRQILNMQHQNGTGTPHDQMKHQNGTGTPPDQSTPDVSKLLNENQRLRQILNVQHQNGTGTPPDQSTPDVSKLLNENQRLRQILNVQHQNGTRTPSDHLPDQSTTNISKLLNENQRLQGIIDADSHQSSFELEIKNLKNLVKNLYELYESEIESEKREIVRLRNVIVEQSIININEYNLKRRFVPPNVTMVH